MVSKGFSFFAPSPGPPEFTEELHMRQETDGVLLESYLIYEPGTHLTRLDKHLGNIQCKWIEDTHTHTHTHKHTHTNEWSNFSKK